MTLTNLDKSALAQRTSEQIGWHRHGSFWVNGILVNDGCELCDLAQRWLDSQRDWRDLVAEQIRAARPMSRQNIDPHRPRDPDEADKPSLNKITRPKMKTRTNWSKR